MAMIASIPHSTVTYPSHYHRLCPCCHSRVKFAYPGRKRVVRDLYEIFEETRYYYRCTNKNCLNSSIAFNPAPKSTILEKRYSNSVWKWIGQEAKVFNSNAPQIHKRIQESFGLEISENTIRNIIDEIDCYLEGKIDDDTKKRVSSQGKIVLSMDGQKPEDGAGALWLFVDLISDRVLDIQILESADHLTLQKCVEKILTDYNVELIGLLSDKQGSIVKMHAEFYPDIPHQYCHFHFLQNIWNFIEVKDSTLQKQLAKMINHLQITTRGKDQTLNIPKLGIVNYREFFSPIEKDLRKLIKNRGKKFEKLRGIQSFIRVQEYNDNMMKFISSKPQSNRITKVLSASATKITECLTDEIKNFQECKDLFDDFKQIQKTLGAHFNNASDLDESLTIIFNKIWESIKNQRKSLKEIKAALPKKEMNSVVIKEQWYRLFRSYRKGLGKYYEFPVRERTNSKMEQKFGQEKMKFIQRSGKANVSRQIRVRGKFELKMQYVPQAEIKSYIDDLEGSYSQNEVKKGLEKLRERQETEKNNWNSSIGGLESIEKLFKSIK